MSIKDKLAERRDEHFNFQMNKEEFNLLMYMANKFGMSKASYLRSLYLKEFHNLPEDEKKSLMDNLRSIHYRKQNGFK